MEVAHRICRLDHLSADLLRVASGMDCAPAVFSRSTSKHLFRCARLYEFVDYRVRAGALFEVCARAAEPTPYAPAVCRCGLSMGGIVGVLPDVGPRLFETSRW